MTFQLYRVDAWIEPDGSWTYNESRELPVVIEIKGEPTTRKILNAMYKKEILSQRRKYKVEDFLSYNGIWTIQQRDNGRPLYDLMSLEVS